MLLFPKGPLQAALRADSQLFPAVFQALRQIDTDAFIREGRVYGGGLYKMEPKELGRLASEPVVEVTGGWKPARHGVLLAHRRGEASIASEIYAVGQEFTNVTSAGLSPNSWTMVPYVTNLL